MRKLARVTPPETIAPLQPEDIITEIREYTLITPLFGGGAKTFEYDPITVVRAPEVRGQLRFWWRACRGANTKDGSQTMQERENAIWGKAYKEKEEGIATSKVVNIQVEKTSTPIPVRSSEFPSYVGFSLQPSREERRQNPGIRPRSVYKNVSFKLIMRFPVDLEAEVRAALWAWETFGGIGARTRRGFGALRLEKVNGVANTDLPGSGNVADVQSWLQKKLQAHLIVGTWVDGTPHLSRRPRLHITAPSTDATAVWKDLVAKLASFRQISFGRIKRSHWPEAEAIRGETGRRDHEKYKPLNHPRKFPRAAFGLPIVFHFKDTGDPPDTTLQLKDKKEGDKVIEKRDRFASPLILKPLLCANKQSVGIALILEGSHYPAEGLVLKESGRQGREHKVSIQDTQLTTADLKRLPNLKLNNETDILEAFMKYLGGIIK